MALPLRSALRRSCTSIEEDNELGIMNPGEGVFFTENRTAVRSSLVHGLGLWRRLLAVVCGRAPTLTHNPELVILGGP